MLFDLLSSMTDGNVISHYKTNAFNKKQVTRTKKLSSLAYLIMYVYLIGHSPLGLFKININKQR